MKVKMDSSGSQTALQQAGNGTNRRIRTMAVISAANPMNDNGGRRPNEKLIRQLAVGHYRFFEVMGSENSVMVYNISLDDTQSLCRKHDQECVLFVDLTGGGEVPGQFEELFLEHVRKICEDLASRENRMDVDRLLTESMNPCRTGKSRYMKRGQLYGKLPK